MTTCAILQPSYIPWRGYFHQIQKSDVFVFYDDVQYDKHGWRNRNRVKTANGTVWLSVPVRHKGNVTQGIPIKDIEIAWDQLWSAKHWATVTQSYARAPHFRRYAPLLEPYYAGRPRLLVDLTINLTIELARALGLETRFVRSSELGIGGHRTARLLAILQALGADRYVCGPASRAYLEEDELTAAGIAVEYMRYDYPTYPQLHPPFDGQVSILDPLFMLGPEAPRQMWSP